MSEQHHLEHQNKKTSFNLLLGTGIAFVLLGIFLLGILSSDIEIHSIGIYHLAFVALGGVLLFLAIVKVRRKSVMFAGLFLVLTGLLLFFIRTKHIPYTLDALWPLVVVIGGVSLLVSSLFVHRRIRISQVIPSVSLLLLGGCCLLFSLHIIQQPFLQFAGRWWPVLLIAAGFCLVILFFIWNKGSVQLEEVDDDFNDLEDTN
ncbi:MAG: hypothetical protein J6C11_00990 [Spirochaetaceae bacterium]|nr:hypothetical protein [Spirochaetaceae bacterium]